MGRKRTGKPRGRPRKIKPAGAVTADTGAGTSTAASAEEISGPVGHVAVEVDRPALLAEAAAIAADAPAEPPAAATAESPAAGVADPAVPAPMPEQEAAGMQPVLRFATAQLAALAPGWKITQEESDGVADATALVLAYWMPPGAVHPKYVAILSLAGALWSIAAQRRDDDGKFLPMRPTREPEKKPAAQEIAPAANRLAL